MKKVVKKVLDVLTENPTWDTDCEAQKVFYELLKDGKFEKNFILYTNKSNLDGDAYTLPEEELGYYGEESVFYERPLSFYAYLHEDYYTWHNFFVVSFDDGNFIMGDFENVVVASNKKAYDYFTSIIKPERWDYGDI